MYPLTLAFRVKDRCAAQKIYCTGSIHAVVLQMKMVLLVTRGT
jgi:hypothetical protein